MRLDKTDIRILNEMQSDARISVAELAKRVALTPTPCARRLQQFESRVHAYPEVMQCWALSGGSDYLLHVVAPDLEGYNRFLRNELLSLGCVDHVQTGFALQRVVDRTALPLQHLNHAPKASRPAR